MKTALATAYRRAFTRRAFYRFHRMLHDLSLHGLGVMNHEAALSGERTFLRALTGRIADLVMVDVGANDGDYSADVRALAPRSQVHAFEPHPVTYGRLATRARELGFAAHNLALGAQPGRLALYDYAGSSGTQHASVYADVISRLHDGGEPVAHDIAVDTLDAFAERQGIARIDLLKIDTEGHELQVLNGARGLIASGALDVVHFEFNEMNVVSRVFLRDFFDVLPGFRLYRMLPDGLAPLGAYHARRCEIFAYQNIVALRADGRLASLADD